MADKNKGKNKEEAKAPSEIEKAVTPPQITPEMKKKLDNIKATVEKVKDELIKKFDKYIVGVALLPPSKEKKDIDKINVFVLVDDSDSQKMSKDELKNKLGKIIDSIAKDIDKNLRTDTMIISDLKEACFDGKYDILEMIARSAIVYDKGMLTALKVSEIHKTMAIKKFEKYIVSYVAAGSLFRGDANPQDIDVYVVVDDTDVKKMSRAELKDKLRAIIAGMGFEASMIAGDVKAQFHVQTYILTDFWDNIKDANPVVFTFLRDGVPLYDRGVFMPWKLLLQMGRIKPSPEAIDMNMDIGEKLIQRIKHKLLSVVGEDLYYAALNPAQAALMLYGLPPPTPKETVKLMEEIFVKKEKLLDKKYVDILEKIRRYYKDVEHGKLKEIKGKEIDDMLTSMDDYLKRIRKLFEEIESKAQVEGMVDIYDTCMTITRDALVAVGKDKVKDITNDFEQHLVATGKLPDNLLRTLNKIIKAKKDFDEKKLTRQEVDKIKKDARQYIKLVVEFIQRTRAQELEKAKIRFKYANKFGEILLLDKIAFLMPDMENREEVQKAKITEKGGLDKVEKSSLEELEKSMADVKIPDRVFIKEKIFEDLRKIFGSDVEVLVTS